jgi:hypothetical protein
LKKKYRAIKKQKYEKLFTGRKKTASIYSEFTLSNQNMEAVNRMSKQAVSVTFPEKEEEITCVFLLEDIIKEYNHKIVLQSTSTQKKKFPLSLRPLKESAANSTIRSALKENSAHPAIRPMTQDELKLMRSYELKENDSRILSTILHNQYVKTGLIANVPAIAQGATLLEVIQELGLKGKVYYKTVGEKTYVILKGFPGKRAFLKGTTYLNTHPQIVQFGLAKVTVKSLFASGFKASIWVYGAIKTLEATEMVLQDGELKTSFFSQIGTDIPKIAITSAVTAAATGTVAVAGIPVAVGVGIVLVVGFAAGVAIEYLDQKTGLTERFNEAADKMWKSLKEYMSNSSKSQQKVKDWDPQKGLVFGGPFASQTLQNYLVYTV